MPTFNFKAHGRILDEEEDDDDAVAPPVARHGFPSKRDDESWCWMVDFCLLLFDDAVLVDVWLCVDVVFVDIS